MEENKISIPQSEESMDDVITEIGSPIKGSLPTPTLMEENKISTPQSDESMDDVITEDGILCVILSKLTLREAVGTCVLSPRWRHIWTHLPKLIFRPANIFDHHTLSLLTNNSLTEDEKLEIFHQKTDHFVQSVCSVMQQHQGHGGVEEFEVRYFLRGIHFHHLDAWLRIALSSKTRVLGLHLSKPFYRGFEGETYEFRFPQLGPSSSLEELVLQCCSFRLPCEFDGPSHLKSLRLYNVDIAEEDITRLLSNCYTLESLIVRSAQRVVTLTIPHSQTRLKHVSVKNCNNCRQIKIDAVNLRTIRYHGNPVDFILGPSLQLKSVIVLFRIEYLLKPNLDYYLNKVSSSMPHLEYLSFCIADEFEVPDLPIGISKFSHLRRLDLFWNAGVKMSLLHLTTILDASPLLIQLFLKLSTPCTEQPPRMLQQFKEQLPKHDDTRLLRIVFRNYNCDWWHIQFALYLLKNSPGLKWLALGKGGKTVEEMQIDNLRQVIPADVKLVIF